MPRRAVLCSWVPCWRSALSEPLEPLYLENLKAAIDKLRAGSGGGGGGGGDGSSA